MIPPSWLMCGARVRVRRTGEVLWVEEMHFEITSEEGAVGCVYLKKAGSTVFHVYKVEDVVKECYPIPAWPPWLSEGAYVKHKEFGSVGKVENINGIEMMVTTVERQSNGVTFHQGLEGFLLEWVPTGQPTLWDRLGELAL